jgi:hypothetical protein
MYLDTGWFLRALACECFSFCFLFYCLTLDCKISVGLDNTTFMQLPGQTNMWILFVRI